MDGSRQAGLDRGYLDFVAFETIQAAHAIIAKAFVDPSSANNDSVG